MKCWECIFHIQEWHGVTERMTTTGGMTLHHFCNNPECEYYGKEVVRIDYCEHCKTVKEERYEG